MKNNLVNSLVASCLISIFLFGLLVAVATWHWLIPVVAFLWIFGEVYYA